ncbi:phytanoyl-CoA dioxygenase family protein [Ideonella sp.]|uniref:phytanoyl-CoA dioxygenase family protein n=1 Tax=Ideonella sp. TaxID=1929293 RepID=UPI0035AD7AA5
MLSKEQAAAYEDRGYLIVPECLSARAVDNLRAESEQAARDLADPGRVTEGDGVTVRGLHGVHLRSELMNKLCSHPKLLAMAKQLLGTDVYVHQFKLNVKAAFVGDIWEWHQDMTFYHREDEVPEPAFLTMAVLLDDSTDFNGPLLMIPGSHKEGFHIAVKNEIAEYDAQSPWLSNTTAKLRYTADRNLLKRMVEKNGIVTGKGRAGDCIVFHANLFHGSGVNMSPFDRRVAFISYNSVTNVPRPTRPARPEFLCAQNHAALEPCYDEAIA